MKDTKCLNPDCQTKRASRGLCQRCYQIAKNLVKNGKTTWDRLESKGKALPARTKRKTKTSNWLLS